jgi:hypothetical protein
VVNLTHEEKKSLERLVRLPHIDTVVSGFVRDAISYYALRLGYQWPPSK